MIGLGLTQLEVANLVGVSDRTLRTRYRRELDTGVSSANLRVAQSLFNMATKGQVPSAAIWWTKARMGWKEATDLNVGGQGGGPLVYEFRWADAPQQPPTIEAQPVSDTKAEPEPDADGGASDAGPLVVTWAGED